MWPLVTTMANQRTPDKLGPSNRDYAFSPQTLVTHTTQVIIHWQVNGIWLTITDVCLTSHWCLPDKPLMSAWQATDVWMTSHYCMLDNSSVSTWQVTDVCLTSHWCLPDKSLMSAWQVTGVCLTSYCGLFVGHTVGCLLVMRWPMYL